MRRCTFERYARDEEGEFIIKEDKDMKKGTRYEMEIVEAYFLEFKSETNDEGCTYPVAIVALENGEVKIMNADNITFSDMIELNLPCETWTRETYQRQEVEWRKGKDDEITHVDKIEMKLPAETYSKKEIK